MTCHINTYESPLYLNDIIYPLIQLQLTLTIASFAIAVGTMVAGAFGMNIPCQLYAIDGVFSTFVGVLTAACVLLFLLVLGYARWKKLLGS